MNLETRIKIEKAIVRKLVKETVKRGDKISVYDGEEWPVKKSRDVADIMDHIFSVDESHIMIRDNNDEKLGRVFFVFGNDGYDVISDYSLTLEDYDPLQIANAKADYYERQHC